MKTTKTMFVAMVLALGLAACAGESVDPKDTDGGTEPDPAGARDARGNGGAGGGGGAGTGGGGGSRDASASPDRPTDRPTPDAKVADRAPPLDEGPSTGACVTNADCQGGQFCKHVQIGRCYTTDLACTSGKLNIYCKEPGQLVAFCVPRPSAQDCQNKGNHAVCGCDFKTYENYCFAEVAGTSLADYDNGACPQ